MRGVIRRVAFLAAAWLPGVLPAAAASPSTGAAKLTVHGHTQLQSRALTLTLVQATAATPRQQAEWRASCKVLGRYLGDQLDFAALKTPAAQVEALQGALARLSYVAKARCEAAEAGWRCTLVPRPMVVRSEVVGRLPWSMLRGEVHRRLFLRPGMVLQDLPGDVLRQQQRLSTYLQNEGLVGSRVRVRALASPLAWPHQGVLLQAQLWPGHGLKVRHVQVHDSPLPQHTLAALFSHRLPLFLGRRSLRPEALRDDEEAARRTLQLAGYPAASVRSVLSEPSRKNEVDLHVWVRSGPHLQIALEGHAALRDKALRAAATFDAAAAVDALEMEATRKAMLALYAQKGYDACDIGYTVAVAADRSTVVTYHIDEGRAHRLAQVEVRGNAALPEAQLRAEGPLLCVASGLLTRRLLRESVDHDLAALQRVYRAHGFADVKVTAQTQLDGDAYRLTFKVHEGPHVRVAALEVDPMPITLPALRLQAGADFEPEALTADADRLQLALTQAGYLHAQVQPQTSVQADGVRLHHRIEPGPLAITGELMLSGALRTAPGIVLQEFPLRRGDPLDLQALGQMRRRLRRLNIFADVQLRPVGEGIVRLDAQGQAQQPTWLELGLQERAVQSLDALLSFSTDDWFALGADFADQNGFGRAILLALEARLAFASGPPWLPRIGNVDRLSGRLRAPRPLALPFDVEVTSLYLFQDYPVFTARKSGGSAALLRQFFERGSGLSEPGVAGRFAYEFSQGYLDIHAAAPRASLLRRAPRNLPSATFGRLVPSLNLDGRDQALNPQRGYAANLRLELALPFFAGPLWREAATFWRLNAGLQAYFPLGRLLRATLLRGLAPPSGPLGSEVVLALSLGYSLAGTFAADQQVPDSETFYYGGDFSVRGLANRASQSALLATALLSASAELRWTAWHTGWGDWVVAGFCDVAGASLRPTAVARQPTLSAGPALRFVTLVGPFSLAYGWPLRLADLLRDRPDVAPPHGRLHITFGTSF